MTNHLAAVVHPYLHPLPMQLNLLLPVDGRSLLSHCKNFRFFMYLFSPKPASSHFTIYCYGFTLSSFKFSYFTIDCLLWNDKNLANLRTCLFFRSGRLPQLSVTTDMTSNKASRSATNTHRSRSKKRKAGRPHSMQPLQTMNYFIFSLGYFLVCPDHLHNCLAQVTLSLSQGVTRCVTKISHHDTLVSMLLRIRQIL